MLFAIESHPTSKFKSHHALGPLRCTLWTQRHYSWPSFSSFTT